MISRLFEPYVRPIQDDDTLHEILRVVREAKQELVLVSPYNNYPGHLERAVREAIDRNIPVTLVCRENHLGDSEQKERRHWETLEKIGAQVHLVKDLHAKIYYNESYAIVTSMNLHTSSASNSREFGFLVRDSEIRNQIRTYVLSDLISGGTRFTTKRSAPPTNTPTVAPAKSVPVKPRPSGVSWAKGKGEETAVRGSCIGCGKEIELNREYPRCRDCYRRWNRDKESPESYCHGCGRRRTAAFGKPISSHRPLCSTCHKEMKSAT